MLSLEEDGDPDEAPNWWQWILLLIAGVAFVGGPLWLMILMLVLFG